METNFKFDLGQTVTRSADNKVGIINSRADYLRQEPQYNFEYENNQGDLQYVWLPASELSA